MSPAAGMGDAFKDWVSPREKAEQEFFEPEAPPEPRRNLRPTVLTSEKSLLAKLLAKTLAKLLA